MKQARVRSGRAEAEWVRDRIGHVLARRCRLAEAALCPDGSPCAALRRALDRAIVDYLVLLRARTGREFDGSLDCPGRSPAWDETADKSNGDAPAVVGEPWLSAFAPTAQDEPRSWRGT